MGTNINLSEVLQAMTDHLGSLEIEIVQLWEENWEKDIRINKLRDQIVQDGPSMTTGSNDTFMAMLKAFFDKKESRVKVPKPHNWEGDQKGFDTFKRECMTWLEDRNLVEDDNIPKVITMVAGWMKGLATQ